MPPNRVKFREDPPANDSVVDPANELDEYFFEYEYLLFKSSDFHEKYS